ncbi:MAG TPA: hypothetical protein VKH37_14010 [Ferruginibacter sp.]|nr:hypothetical protein [Ferruginibacter sp.]
MKNFRPLAILTLFFLSTSMSSKAQNDFCSNLNKVKALMESGFSSVKGKKLTEGTTNYGTMEITKRMWVSSFQFPESISANVTEILKVAPDPKNAGHNVYITFNFANSATRAVVEAIYNKFREFMKQCVPANWKAQERSGTTYSRYYVMDGSYYDEAPHKITLQFNKLEGAGDKYTADLIFDSAIK